MRRTELAALLALLALAVAGCGGAASRAWQRAELSTHDWQRAFQAAQDVLASHFEIAESSLPRGAIETRPELVDRPRTGTLADIRGAGGRWRRTVSLELERSGLAVGARAAVRLEREATASAVALADSGGYERRPADVPRAASPGAEPGAAAQRPVWVEVGYDAGMAREILAEIAERVRKLERGDAVPAFPSPKEAAEERRKMGPRPGP